MTGHSKWANVQHRRVAQHRNRGTVVCKLVREIEFAARSGGPELNRNARLRLAVEKARGIGVPEGSIESALQRSRQLQTPAVERVRYEGYGPGGVALIVDCLTDDPARTVADVRRVFTSHGGNLGAHGSVGYLFNLVGLMTFAPGTDLEQLSQAALHAGAEDVVPSEDGAIEVLADPAEFDVVRAIITSSGFAPAVAELTQRAATPIRVSGPAAEQMVRLLEALEDLNDVQSVYSNVEISDEVLARV